MATRVTVNFSNSNKHLYDRLVQEENVSQVICKALEEYYDLIEDDYDFEENVITRLDVMLDLLEKIEKR